MKYIKLFEEHLTGNNSKEEIEKSLNAHLDNYNQMYTRWYNAKTNRDDRNEFSYDDYLNPNSQSSGPTESEMNSMEKEMKETKEEINKLVSQWKQNNLGEMSAELKKKLESI